MAEPRQGRLGALGSECSWATGIEKPSTIHMGHIYKSIQVREKYHKMFHNHMDINISHVFHQVKTCPFTIRIHISHENMSKWFTSKLVHQKVHIQIYVHMGHMWKYQQSNGSHLKTPIPWIGRSPALPSLLLPARSRHLLTSPASPKFRAAEVHQSPMEYLGLTIMKQYSLACFNIGFMTPVIGFTRCSKCCHVLGWSWRKRELSQT